MSDLPRSITRSFTPKKRINVYENTRIVYTNLNMRIDTVLTLLISSFNNNLPNNVILMTVIEYFLIKIIF